MDSEHEVYTAADMVMLEIAYSPVIPEPFGTTPCEVQPTMGGDSWIVQMPDGTPFAVSSAELQVMRARYLVTRGRLISNWNMVAEGDKQAVAHKWGIPVILPFMIRPDANNLPPERAFRP